MLPMPAQRLHTHTPAAPTNAILVPPRPAAARGSNTFIPKAHDTEARFKAHARKLQQAVDCSGVLPTTLIAETVGPTTGRAYKIYARPPTNRTNWHQARKICQCTAPNYDLPVYGSLEEQRHVENVAGRPRAYWIGYWIPPENTNFGVPFLTTGDSAYETNSLNRQFADSFYGVDYTGPFSSISSNPSNMYPYRHWCKPTSLRLWL